MRSSSRNQHNDDYYNDCNDVYILKEQIQIKSESLLLLSQQLENSIKEKDEFKRLIDTLYDKNLILKKKLYNQQHQDSTSPSSFTDAAKKQGNHFSYEADDIDSEEYIKILKDVVKTLKKEKYDLIQKYDETKQELDDCKLDLKLLREQITRQRIGGNAVITTRSATNVDACAQQQNEREMLIKEIEMLKEKNLESESDLKMIICQKEEFELERDSYKSKFKMLNQFLVENSTLGKQQLINRQILSINIDEIISSNKYLVETNKNLKEEIRLLNENLNKYKKTPQQQQKPQASSNEESSVLNKREIKALLKKSNEFLELNSLNSQQPQQMVYSLKLIKELSTVCDALLDSLNDKHVGLQHQRKCNKLLATRIQDLEIEINSFKTTSSITNDEDSLIKFNDDDENDCKLYNLINDLASKLKLNKDKKKIEKQVSLSYNDEENVGACVAIEAEEEEEEEEEDEKIISNYKKSSQELFDQNLKINRNNEPLVLNT